MTRANTVYLHDLGLVCALGDSKDGVAQALFNGSRDSLTVTDAYTPARPLPVGQVRTLLPSVHHLPPHQQTRSNQLLLAALEQLRDELRETLSRVDPLRVGVVLGTSTSGIDAGEEAIAALEAQGAWPENFSYRQQEMYNPAESLAEWLGARGPAFSLSTACSSGAKALASGRRLLREGICDLVIAGGVDVLCRLTVNGFSALESVSDAVCNPFSRNRNGINIGEGAGLFVMSKEEGPVALRGVGETSDAHHISAPAPDGRGAARAMQLALRDAGISAEAIDYLNLHGTATPQNDAMESAAVNSTGMQRVPASSTKAYTGHTLGAAGALEAGFCWLTLMQNSLMQDSFASGADAAWNLPVHLWDQALDPELAAISLVAEPRQVEKPRYAMSNSFAFGGNNIAVILERHW